jgi:protein disulfide-isomerase
MKKFAIGLIAGLALLRVSAQEVQWMTDLPKALAKAKAEHKMVMMDFNGSDWCPPCKALHKNVLESPEFAKFAKDNLVLVDVDFPNKKQQSAELKKANAELQKKYEIKGYPTIVVLDADGKELNKKVGYSGQKAPEFIAALEKLKKS